MNREEQAIGPKHRPMKIRSNNYLNPNEYSRYSFTPDFLASAEEIIDSIECLESYHYSLDSEESIINLLIGSLSHNGDVGKELRLVKHILETGTVEAVGTQGFVIRPGLNIPIRQAWIDETFGNDMFELETFIRAGLIQQHLSIEATAIREILQRGLISYIADTAHDYDTVETLVKHLIWLFDQVDEDELGEREIDTYRQNIYSKILDNSVDYDQLLVDRLETVLEYHTIESHLSLKAPMAGEKPQHNDTDTAHNIIHGYLRLWHKEDTTQKDI